tara:strand:- start:5139 stop:6116 length:978 start_codon:yes stop_codon:yes gene_type:complete
METLAYYQKLGIRFISKKPQLNPTQTGYGRKIFVLYAIGRFGFSSKIVCQYALQLPREAINKLFRKLMIDGLINERKSFGSKDGAVYYLSAKGERYISFETEVAFHQKTDTSAHNSKTEIHDLSIQICVLDRLLNSDEYSAFVTEKELREIGYGSWGELKKERAVDGLLYHADSRQWHAVEVETANSKNKKTAQHNIREEILNKYVNQLENSSGLYARILFFSHRERFLRQIKTRTEEILAENKGSYTSAQQALIDTELKYVHSFCPTLYQLFWDMDYKLAQPTHTKIELERLNSLLQGVWHNEDYSDEFKDGYERAISDINPNI